MANRQAEMYCFIDVETTGLDANVHEIVEVASIRCDENMRILREHTYRVMPRWLANADPHALEVNGFNEEEWRKTAVPHELALSKIADDMDGAIPCGHNVAFDVAFLKRAFGYLDLLPDTGHHYIDTVGLAWSMRLLTGYPLESLSLDAVCAMLGIARPSPHRAYDDAMASLLIAREWFHMSLGPRSCVSRILDSNQAWPWPLEPWRSQRRLMRRWAL